ncbi:MAG: restriction endonuclease subunit S [Anaerolineales bacterium]|nr:restriction endonuclease subunit S [Anaerolineales bacterium]
MEVRKGYKQTEVGTIPSDWEIKKLSSFAELTSSKRIFESDYVSSGIPFYRGKEISLLINNAPLDDEYFILEEKYDEIKRQFGAPRKGDILITAVGTLGNVYLVPNDNAFYFKDGNLIWLRNIKNVLPDYLTIQLRNRKTEILNNAIGSTQKALTIIVLNETLIPIPPTLPEQEAIAEALSDADAFIESLETLLAKKRQVKQGAMSDLLTGKRRVVESGEWEEKRLGDFVKITKGQLITEKNVNPGVIPVIAGGKEPAYYHNKPNRLGKTITISASGANAGYVAFHEKPIFASDCSTIEESASYSIQFIYQLLLSNQQKIYKTQTGGAQPHVHAKDLNPLIFKFPPLAEQTAIAEILSDMDAEIRAVEEKLSKARGVKAGMMSELLTGRTRLV